VSSQPDSVTPASALSKASSAQALREDTRERMALFGQQMLNAFIDLLFLAMWAAMAAGQRAVLNYLDAPQWIHWLGIFFDLTTFTIVATYVTVDVITSVRQMWARRRR
jgi:hypothetical protein